MREYIIKKPDLEKLLKEAYEAGLHTVKESLEDMLDDTRISSSKDFARKVIQLLEDKNELD